MSASPQTWILVADDPAVGALVQTARAVGGEVVAVVVGDRPVADVLAAADVDRVLWLGTPPAGTPCEAYAPQVAQLVARVAPGAVLGPTTPAGRVLLGAVAARLRAPILAGATAVEHDGDRVVVDRAVFGGIVERREAVGGTAILALAGGKPPAGTGGPVPVEEVTATPLTTARVTDRTVGEHAGVDLGEARVVVAVGRGLRSEQDLALIEGLARAVRGELACSRPLAEGVHWLSKDRYVGISGQHIAPELYFAIGISGQLHHMVGVRDARTIVAVNTDRDAPVFAECDFGIVGDLYAVVPALTAALAGAS